MWVDAGAKRNDVDELVDVGRRDTGGVQARAGVCVAECGGVVGVAGDFKNGVQLVRESIASGAAWKALETFREAVRTAMASTAA